MKRKILILLIGSILLLSCSGKTEKKDIKKNNTVSNEKNVAENNKGEYLKKITYSNLLDKATQEEVQKELKNAGVSEKNIKDFLEGVNYFNNIGQNKTFVKEGFKTTEELSPTYDQAEIQEQWSKKSPKFVGQNCRITSYELMRDFISVGKPEIKNTEQLFIDEDALNNFPIKVFTDSERNQFESLFSAVNTENTKDTSVHLKKVKEDWTKKNIKFTNQNKISLISVFFHSMISADENILFIGHVGVLVPTSDGKLMFIEKLAFQANARPFIMENDELLKGYRLNPNNKG